MPNEWGSDSFRRLVRPTIAAAVLGAALGAPAVAPGAPSDTSGPSLSVFVPDSSAAAERFSLAQKLQDASEWTKASEIYQELLDSYRDRVVPSDTEQDASGLYVSVAERALRQLAAWPAEGLAAYNGRFEPTAQAMLTAAGEDPVALRPVVERYLLTRSGQAAAAQLMQLYWDQGELASAARLAQRVASLQPQDAPGRPLLLLRCGIAWQLSGNTPRAKEVLTTVKAQCPNATIQLDGKDKNVVAELEHALLASPPSDAPTNSWPAFGGVPDRAAVPSFLGRSDALLFSLDLSGALDQPVQTPFGRTNPNQALGIYPVYDNRELFYLDTFSLHAVTIDGGMKLPEWPATSIQLATGAPPGPSLRALALGSDAVYAVLSDLMPGGWIGEGAMIDSSLVTCIDRHTGKVRWRVSPSTLALSVPSLKATQFASAPLLVGDQLFVVARGGRNAQFHDVYLLAFSAATGKLQFASYVASGPNMSLILMEEMPTSVEGGLPQLSYHAGRVFVATNVGAIAAIEGSDGTPAWLRTYARTDLPPARAMGRFMRTSPNMSVARIFAASPAIISAGHVFALPVDGKQLLVLDEVSGRAEKSIPRASLGNVDTLVGLFGDGLVISGEHIATTLDWSKASEDTAPQTDAVRWSMDFPANTLRGRPFLTAESLFLPTDERLLRIATRNWKIEQTTPPYPATWDDNQGPGNVLVTDDNVIIATAKRVNVYTNLSTATARLDEEVARAPLSPDPMIRYGELLFAASRPAEALAKLQQAVKLVHAEPTAAARDRLFTVALTCANRLALMDGSSPHTQPYLEVARGVALTPPQEVQYHLTAATLSLRRNDGKASLDDLQAILDDSAQRAVLHRDTEGQTRYAADLARKQITQLIDRYGAAIYQPIEQKARAAATTAQTAADSAALLELARRYPNSSTAPSALYAAGQLLEEARKLPEAASVYRQLVQEYPNAADIARFVEAMARVYAAIPGKAAIAAARLTHAAGMYGDPSTLTPMRLPDGQLVQPAKFSEVASALRAATGTQVARPLPDLRLPPMGHTPFAQSVAIDVSAERILPTIPGSAPDYQHVVVLAPNGDISVIDANRKVLARITEVKVNSPTDCAWISPSRLLVRGTQELAVLDIGTSAVVWIVSPEQLPAVMQIAEDAANEQTPDDPDNVDPGARVGVAIQAMPMQAAGIRRLVALNAARRDAGADGITDLAIAGGKVIFGTSSGRLAALDAASGKLLWQLRPESGSILRVSSSDDFTAARVITPKRSQLLCVDNDTGKLVYLRSFQTDSLQNLLVTPDGQLIYTTMAHLFSKDLFDSSDRLLFDAAMTPADQQAFLIQDRVDQLLVVDDYIVATTGNGSFVRMFTRYGGKPVLPGGRDANNVAAGVLVNQRPTQAHLIAAAPYIYAHNQTAIRAINVQRVESPERHLPADVSSIKCLVVGALHVVAIDQPHKLAGVATVPQISVYAFSRTPGNSGESGRLDYSVTLKQESGISSCQMVEGGLYLSTGDKRLIFYPAGQ